MTASNHRARFVHAHRETLFGRFGAAEVLLESPPEHDLDAHTWFKVLQSQQWFADASSGVKPALFDADGLTGASKNAIGAASRLCALGQRAAILRFDRRDAHHWSQLHAQIGGGTETGEMWFAVSKAWSALMGGAPEEAGEIAETLSVRAASEQHSGIVLEAAALKALASSSSGRHEEALGFARRASRMARTESMPQQEYLASIVLARARRLAGKPHLATFILTALGRFASSPWNAWIRWELSLSPGIAFPDVGETHVLPMYQAAAAGHRGDYQKASTRAASVATWLPDLATDVQTLGELIDPMAKVSEELQAWTSGETNMSPRGLQGVVSSDSGAIALVYAHPSKVARRFLICGAPLLPEGTVPFAPAATHVRTDTALATLLLAGAEGLDGDVLWQLVYGFPYIHDKHRTIRNVLHHRMRKRLGEHAALVQVDSMWTVLVRVPISIPDPRCLLPREHTLLTLIARSGTLTATHVAERMGIPLRTAQQTLKELANDGACHAERAGREIKYRLEDTTFTEPTVC